MQLGGETELKPEVGVAPHLCIREAGGARAKVDYLSMDENVL